MKEVKTKTKHEKPTAPEKIKEMSTTEFGEFMLKIAEQMFMRMEREMARRIVEDIASRIYSASK